MKNGFIAVFLTILFTSCQNNNFEGYYDNKFSIHITKINEEKFEVESTQNILPQYATDEGVNGTYCLNNEILIKCGLTYGSDYEITQTEDGIYITRGNEKGIRLKRRN